MTINVNIVNPFKSKSAKTFDKNKVGRDAHADEYLPPADVGSYSGKKIFKFGTTTTVVDVDDNLSKAEPLEHVKPAQSSSLLDACADIHAQKQKKILSKVKSAKNRITRLFKPTGRDSANVPHDIENRTTDHSFSPSLPPILQLAKSEAHVVAACESISTLPSLEVVASPITCGESVVDERIEDASTSCTGSTVETSFSSSIREHSATPEPQSDALSSISERHAIKGKDGRTEQRELVLSASHVSQSVGDPEVTVYFSTNTLSAHTTASEADLVGSETNASSIATSSVTGVDVEDSLRIQSVADRDFLCSDSFSGSSDCDISYRAASSIHAAPLRKPKKCDNLRKSFLSIERKICTQSTRQICKFKKLRAWLSTRGRESSHDTQRRPVSQAPSKSKKVNPTSCSRQFVQGILRPSSHVRAHVSKPPSHQSLSQSTPPIWSCAKITRSSSKAKRRRRMTKRSMKELKARLDSMDIDPWY